MPLTNAEKWHVLNVSTKVSEDNPHVTQDKVVSLVVNATSISKVGVYHARIN
jgi:hypothetical protein